MERQRAGTPACKLSAAPSADLREQTIRQLMEDDGVPRWRAEQMVVAPQRFKQFEERGHRDSARRRQLHKQLHGAGYVGQAFRKLCDAGCDGAWLEHRLLSLHNFPLTRKRRKFNASDKRQLRRIAQGLEHAGRELAKFDLMILLSTITDWPVPRQEVASIVEGIGYCLGQVAASRSWEGLTIATGSFRIPYVIEQIKHFTGRPHYAEMATLIGAAYGRPDYSEGELKMLVLRTARRPK